MTETSNGFQWRSQSTLVIVAVGATLSLNDFLTFPILAGQNGGGAFLIFYVLFLFLLGLPLMMGEFLLGRISRSDSTHCFEALASHYKASIYWKLTGFMSVVAAVLVVATLSVIAGWTFAYFIKSAIGVYQGIAPEAAVAYFEDFLLDSERMAFWLTMFVIGLLLVVSQPVKLGMQKLFCILLPVMLVLLVIVLIIAVYSSGFIQSVRYLLYVDFSVVSSDTPLLALQRAFYTLTLGLGVMIAIGRYMPSSISPGYSAVLIISADLLFGIFFGLAINALIISSATTSNLDTQFAFNLLPAILGQFELGQLFGAMCFYYC